MAELRQETEANSTYIKDLGYKLVEMWECEWLRLARTNLRQMVPRTRAGSHSNLSSGAVHPSSVLQAVW